jgi:hypothetical protein
VPRGLKRYHESGQTHFVTFSCYRSRALLDTALERGTRLKRFYRRKLAQKGLGKATVAAARKRGIRLWIMLRDNIDYEEFCRRGRRDGGSPCGIPDENVVPTLAVTVVPE